MAGCDVKGSGLESKLQGKKAGQTYVRARNV
jgi:hypothetical protein